MGRRAVQEYVLYFDGGSRGNPGPGGCGAVLTKNEKAVWCGWDYLDDPKTTNNVAEYCALLLGAKELKSRGIHECLICGDSKLVVEQMSGRWKVRDSKLAALKALIDKQLTGDFSFQHIDRDKNGQADALANKAMDDRLGGSKSLDISDVRVEVFEAVRSNAQAQLDLLRDLPLSRRPPGDMTPLTDFLVSIRDRADTALSILEGGRLSRGSGDDDVKESPGS